MKPIRELAILALDDPDAVGVLGDAVQESGWFDRRALYLLRPNTRPRGHQQRKFRRLSAAPNAEWARAIAAVFLFGGWASTRWPAIDRCQATEWLGPGWGLETLAGEYLDRFAESIFGLTRTGAPGVDFETDEELRARMRAVLGRLSAPRQQVDMPHPFFGFDLRAAGLKD